MPHPTRRPTREELLHTLEACRHALPSNVHPVHHQRLDYLESLVRSRSRLCPGDRDALER